MAAPKTAPMTLLQQLEDAGRHEKAGALGRGAGVWRGFAFSIEALNLVVPLAEGLRVVPCRAVSPLPVPLSREWVRGIILVDGEIYTVIDFARFIGRRPVASNADASLLLMTGEEFNSALLLDSRISLKTFSEPQPEPETADIDPAVEPFVSASLVDGAQTWGVLDIKALMNSGHFIGLGQ